MNGFLGVFSKKGKPIHAGKLVAGCSDFLRLAQQPLVQNIVEGTNYWAAGFTRGSRSTQLVEVDKTAGLILVGHIQIFNGAELCERLAIKEKTPGAALMLRAYQKWGVDCVKYVNGDFCFVVWDNRNDSLFCARDPLGQKPFYYYRNEDFFVFANWVQLLSAHGEAEGLDSSWITNQLLFNKTAVHHTAFANIKSLPPGHTLLLRKDSCQVERYWDLAKRTAAAPVNYAEAVEGLGQHLQNAVKSRLDQGMRVGVELSGGIDSVSIATLAQDILLGLDSKIQAALTNALPAMEKTTFNNFHDEWDAASDVVNNLKICKHIAVDDYLFDIYKSLERVLDVHGMPTMAVFGVGQEHLFSLASGAGITTLFSGLGGNELVTEHAANRYRYNLARDGQFFSLYRSFKESGVVATAVLKRAGYFYGSYLRNSEKKRYTKSLQQLLQSSLLKDEVVAALPQDYDPTFVTYPNQTLEERSLSTLFHPGLLNRVESGYFFASCHGMDYRHPLLDVPLIEYYYNLSSRWKAADPRGRGMFRAAMKGRVPDKLLFQVKSRQTSTFPFYKMHFAGNFSKLKDYVLSLDPGKTIFEYVDKEKIARLELPPGRVQLPYYWLRMVAMVDLFLDRRKK